ncbi:MAG TPA: SMC family ATPase, partial [Thermodesulfobacteriota bacterium]
MVPLQLSLKNFLSYSEYAPTLDFRGFNIACLSGKNGHGKSALLDALTWVLWGKCRAKNKEEIIKRGAREARVELEFELEGNRYRVLRTIMRKKGFSTSASLDFQVFDTDTGTFRVLSQGVKAQETIEKVLRMDYDSFICSAFILQGRADEFTKKTPAERKDVLARILGLERYEELSKRAREIAQESKLEVIRVEREVADFESEISEKEGLNIKLNETKREEENITSTIREKDKLYEGIIRESEALRSKTETFKKLTVDKENLLRELN